MREPVLPPIPLEQARDVVNGNIAAITGTIRASGSVDGYFTTDSGRRRSYSVSGIMFYLAPSYLRFDLEKLGDRQFLFGSNASSYWIYSREDEQYFCGRADEPETLPPDIPIRPDQIPAALGLAPIGGGGDAAAAHTMQRIAEDHQEVLFLVPDADGGMQIEKEYWLDRRPPRLVRRVVFRGADGEVTMISELSEYKPISVGGPLLPHKMSAQWPGEGAAMSFDVGRWELVPQVGPDGPQFATPAECQSATTQ